MASFLRGLWTIARRLLFLVAVLLVGLNVVTWVVLNSPPVQRSLVAWVNGRYLSPRGLELSLGSLAVRFLTTSLVIDGVRVRTAATAPAVAPSGGAAPADAAPVEASTRPWIPGAEAFDLSVERIEVGVDALTSWLREEVVVDKVRLSGVHASLAYDPSGALVLPFETGGGTSGPAAAIFAKVRRFLPVSIVIEDSSLTLGDVRGPLHQSILVREVRVENVGRGEGRIPLAVRLAAGPAKLRLPALPVDVDVESLDLSANVADDLGIAVESFATKSSLGNVTARGRVRLPLDGAQLAYTLPLEADVDFHGVMQLVGLHGTGSVHVAGTAEADPKDPVIPMVRADVAWTDAELEGFALYSGSGKASLAERAIAYSDAVVKTPRGGVIRGEGRFELYDRFLFTNDAHIEGLPFTELLAGFGPRTDAMDFLIAGEDIGVDGRILDPDTGEVDFSLEAFGAVRLTDLHSPSLEKGSARARPPLPSCHVDVKLNTTDEALTLSGSTLRCRPDGSDLATLTEGSVAYTDGASRFKFRYRNADLSGASYFTTGFSTAGSADIDGEVTATAKSGVVFRSHTVARNLLLYGVRYDRVEGDWGIDGRGVFGKGLRGAVSESPLALPAASSGAPAAPANGTSGPSRFSESSDSSSAATRATGRLELDAFRVDFDAATTSLFQGRYQGDLAAVFSAVSSYLPARFPRFDGRVGRFEVSLRGPLLDPRRWTLDVDGLTEDLATLGFRSARTQLRASCVGGRCHDSKLFVQRIVDDTPLPGSASSGRGPAPAPAFPSTAASASAAAPPDPKSPAAAWKQAPAAAPPAAAAPRASPSLADAALGQQSYLLADVRELSLTYVNARVLVRALPLRLDLKERFPIRGVIDARADVIGAWKAWEGSLQVAVDSLRLGEQDLGGITLSGFSAGGKDINLVAYARYQQLSVRVRMPHSLSGPSTLYARTRGLDLGFLLPKAMVAKHNLFTQLDGEVLFTGPAPLTSFDDGATSGAAAATGGGVGSAKPWYARWEAQGSFSRAAFQFRQLRFALESKTAFSLGSGVLSLPGLRLTAPAGFVEGSGRYDFSTADVEATLKSRVDLRVLEDLFGKIGAAEGLLVADVSVSGALPEAAVTGEARVENGSIAPRDYPPPFSDIQGEFLFDDDKLEVRSLRARKGTGEVEVAGSVNWSRWLEDASRYPVIAMRLQARDAQVRVPVPYVEFFDTVVDGTLDLSGDELPYDLSGEIRLKRAATFRDKTCQDLITEEQATRAEDLGIGAQSPVRLNVLVSSDKGIILQTACVKSRLSANVRVTGTSQAPVIGGVVETDNGSVSFLKSNFVIQRAEFTFDNPVRLDPRIDIQLLSRIEAYTVYVSVDGTLLRRRTNLWVDPPNSPDGGSLSRSDIFRMLSTGQPPNRAGTQGQAIASQVAAYGTSVLALDDSLTQAASRLTGGFIDSVQLQPLIENGQTRWRARVSRSLGERLSLGLDIEQGQAVNNQSLNGTVYINESVNLLGGFDRKSEQTEQYYELSGGLRFQFGSSK